MELAINLFSSVTILAYLALAVLSFVNGGLSPRSIVFAVIMILGALWASTTFFPTDNIDSYVIMFKVTISALISLYFFLFLFFMTMIKGVTKKQFIIIVAAGVSTILIVGFATLLMPNSMILNSYDVVDGVIRTEYNALYLLFLNLVAATFGFSALAVAVTAYKRATGRSKTIIRTTMIALIVFAIFDIVFSLFLNMNADGARVIGPMSVLLVGPVFYRHVVAHADDEL